METPGFLRDSRPTRARQYLCSTLGARRAARRSLSVRITPAAGVVAGYRRRSRRAGVVELPAQCRGDEKSPSSKFDTPAAQWEKNWNRLFRKPAVKRKIERLGQLQAPVAFARQQRLRRRWAVV
ncbi:uncharacterized protein TrAtP1_000125 [Trichoderma atroviride]|uniref:uncharacterized protein n=1 Tax=Hypocrea atroviridis TaxID=63577 RepID=UPI00332BB079|nr:hypothetical protein TrAtP1_000125 [Trichoderma atroviride]